MRIILSLAISFLLLGSTSVRGQLSDKLVPHFGFMYEYTLMIERNTGTEPRSFSYPFVAINIGTYYALAHSNDVFSVGIDPSAQLGLRFTNQGIGFLAQAPVFLMGKVGANSTPYNEQKIGLAVGIGGNFSYISINDALFLQGVGIGLDLKQFYINPQAVIEGTVNSRGGPITGRIHFSLAKLAYDGIDYQGILYPTPTVEYNNFGVGLIYGF